MNPQIHALILLDYTEKELVAEIETYSISDLTKIIIQMQKYAKHNESEILKIKKQLYKENRQTTKSICFQEEV